MWPGCCEADKALLVNISTDKTVKYCVFWLSINKVLMSLIWFLITASVTSFQGKNATIIHLLSLFRRLTLSALLNSSICILSAGQHSPFYCDCLVMTEVIVEKGHCLIVNMLPLTCNLQKEILRDKHQLQLGKNVDLVFSTNKHRIGKTGRRLWFWL